MVTQATRRLINKKYKDLAFEASFSGINAFYKALIKENPYLNIDIEDVAMILEEMPVYQMFVLNRKKVKSTRPVERPSGSGISFQLDIAFMEKVDGYTGFLIVVDIYNYYIRAYPLKSKSGMEVRSVVDQMLKNEKLYKCNIFSQVGRLKWDTSQRGRGTNDVKLFLCLQIYS